MSSSSRSGARGLERLILLKYYNAPKWQIIFTLGLNAAKNNDFMEKSFNKSCLELIPDKKSSGRIHLFPLGVESGGLERLMWLKYYSVQKWRIIFTLVVMRIN